MQGLTFRAQSSKPNFCLCIFGYVSTLHLAVNLSLLRSCTKFEYQKGQYIFSHMNFMTSPLVTMEFSFELWINRGLLCPYYAYMVEL